MDVLGGSITTCFTKETFSSFAAGAAASVGTGVAAGVAGSGSRLRKSPSVVEGGHGNPFSRSSWAMEAGTLPQDE